MLVDCEHALRDLKAEILSKRSWGQAELLRKIAELEVAHTRTEHPSDTVMRLYAAEVTDRIFLRNTAGSQTPTDASASAEASGMSNGTRSPLIKHK